MSFELKGASVNGSGTLLATKKAFGSGSIDSDDAVITYGGQQITIKAAIAMGILERQPNGPLVELNKPETPTVTQG